MASFILVYNQVKLNVEMQAKLQTFQENLIDMGINLVTVPFTVSKT